MRILGEADLASSMMFITVHPAFRQERSCLKFGFLVRRLEESGFGGREAGSSFRSFLLQMVR